MDPQNPNNQAPAQPVQTPTIGQPAQAISTAAPSSLLTEVPVAPVQSVQGGQMAASGTEPVAPIPPAPVTNPIPVQSVEQTSQGNLGQPLNQNDSGQVGQGGNQQAA